MTKIDSRASGEIDFPTQEAAQAEADFLNARMSARKFAARQIGGAWYCCQIAWRAPVIGADGKPVHIKA